MLFLITLCLDLWKHSKQLFKFRKYTTTIYRNEYEKQILQRDPNELYKLINISGQGYQGFLVAIYDPSRIHIETTAYLGVKGESILTVLL